MTNSENTILGRFAEVLYSISTSIGVLLIVLKIGSELYIWLVKGVPYFDIKFHNFLDFGVIIGISLIVFGRSVHYIVHGRWPG